MSDVCRLLLGVLGVWRVTHLLQAEDGPWDVIIHIRRAAGEGVLGQLLDCFSCLSLWIAIPFGYAIGRTPSERILSWLAFSGGAVLAERTTSPLGPEFRPMPQAKYEEDKETHE